MIELADSHRQSNLSGEVRLHPNARAYANKMEFIWLPPFRDCFVLSSGNKQKTGGIRTPPEIKKADNTENFYTICLVMNLCSM